MIDTLVTDRTAADVERAAYLNQVVASGNATAAEVDEWNSALKGEYNASDLNRVSSAQTYLAGLFNAFPAELVDYLADAKASVEDSLIYPSAYYTLDEPLLPSSLGQVSYDTVTIETVKTDWDMSDIPIPANTAYYLSNIKILRDILSITAPDTPEDLDGLTYLEANDIEEILVSVYDALLLYEQTKKQAVDDAESAAIDEYKLQAAPWWNCGEIYSGEGEI